MIDRDKLIELLDSFGLSYESYKGDGTIYLEDCDNLTGSHWVSLQFNFDDSGKFIDLERDA